MFLDDEEIALLKRIIAAVGGSGRRQPQGVMEVPNQPIGASISAIELWKRYFFARPGHWRGWMFATPPEITQIEFLDAARTKARAHVTIGYEGAEVVLEKRDDVWHAIELIDRWIT